MFNNRMFAIMKREMKAQIFSKAFIFMTVLMPVIMFGAYFIMFYVMSYDEDKAVNMQIVSSNQTVLESVQKEIEAEKNLNINFEFYRIDDDIESYIDQNRIFLLEDSLEAIVYLPNDGEITKTLDYYSKSANFDLRDKVRNIAASTYLKLFLEDKNINEEQLSYIQQRTSTNMKTVKTDSTSEDEGPVKYIVAILFAFLLYLSVLMIGMSAMRSTTEEKINRVVEVLLSSVNTKELMAGKIIGSTITGLLQMAIWIAPMIVVSATGILAMMLTDNPIDINIPAWHFVYFFLNYLIGLITFVALFAAVGAIFDNDQDAQQGVMPLMMLIMIPFYVAIAIMGNPTNTLGEIASLVPFFSIMVMPVKLSLIETPMWQIFAQLGINVIVMYACIILSAKIYHVAILITGKKPSWKQIFSWLKDA